MLTTIKVLSFVVVALLLGLIGAANAEADGAAAVDGHEGGRSLVRGLSPLSTEDFRKLMEDPITVTNHRNLIESCSDTDLLFCVRRKTSSRDRYVLCKLMYNITDVVHVSCRPSF